MKEGILILDRMKKILIRCCLALPFFSQTVSAQLSIDGCIGDHMVLQRESPIPLQGKAAPHSTLQITFANVTHDLETDAEGNWQTRFPAMAAGGPYELSLHSGEEKLQFKDILLGDVWVCAGQSNMAYSLGAQPNLQQVLENADRPELRYLALRVSYADEPQNTKKQNQWISSTPETAKKMSGVAYHFAANLQTELGVPIGIIKASKGGTFIEGWMPEEAFAQNPILQQIPERWDWLSQNHAQIRSQQEARLAQWKPENEARFKAWADSREAGPFSPLKPPLPPGGKSLAIPAKIYNSAVHPATFHPVKGVVWYQGESNSDRGYFYRKLLKQHVQSWRNAWGQPALPFIVIQLPNYDHTRNPYGPQDGGPWAPVRESQAQILELPHTSLVVTLGLGQDEDVHPKDKSEVGRRAALSALDRVYEKEILGASPQVTEFEMAPVKVILTFSNTGEGLSTLDKQAPRGFELAGEDKVFHPATAKIIAPNQIQISSAEVPSPVALRHAWSSAPDFNVVNSAGLPFSTYRTDTWALPNQEQFLPFWWLEL